MSHPTLRRMVSGCLIGSVLSAAGIVLRESPAPDDDAVRMQGEFQSLVGGLGMGPSADLSQCEFSFDARLQPACSHVQGPIPSGYFLCTRHVGAAASYPHLPLSPDTETDTDDHATSR